MKHQCETCLSTYVWPDSLKRHIKNKHSQPPVRGDDYFIAPTRNGASGVSEGQFRFQAPFCCWFSGPSSSGKTQLATSVLQRCSTLITPAPERIIYLYKHYQPLYDVIKSTVEPKVEFIRGIPANMDALLYAPKRLLLIFDDLQAPASKDARVTELFTEGSHHLGVSVIAINQSLYYNKDPTQRRNCHYLVLFNNPVDKQQVMTLARQMYPVTPNYFMRHFNEATERPFGHLLVDLKANTPESLRLRSNALSETVKKASSGSSDISAQVSRQPAVVEQMSLQSIQTPAEVTQSPAIYKTPDRASAEPLVVSVDDDDDTMPCCDDCGLVFETHHDVQRHIKTWCPDKRPATIDKAEEPPTKMLKATDDGAG